MSTEFTHVIEEDPTRSDKYEGYVLVESEDEIFKIARSSQGHTGQPGSPLYYYVTLAEQDDLSVDDLSDEDWEGLERAIPIEKWEKTEEDE